MLPSLIFSTASARTAIQVCRGADAYKGDVPLIVAVAERRIEQLTETGIIDADFDNLKLKPRTSQPASYYELCDGVEHAHGHRAGPSW
ncbi:hypothetical protein CU103_25060 [Phyllobacterium sophorae]|uniref:Uncharacterized protein n=2 Tax=Phyllobacterium sophorae TaxID=1520277 RepID=A0A2P7B312_9HYPH|nr:hypothetical protein CU103_25060 [Phyllobacterium sophorae]